MATWTDEIQAKFVSCFAITRSLVWYEPLYRKFLARFFRQLVEDGISYVDMRAGFAFKYRKFESEELEVGYHEPIRVLGEELRKFQSSEMGQYFWG